MSAFEGIAMGVMAAASLASAGASISQSMKDVPMPDLPPNAQAGEQSAQDAGQRARRKALMAIGDNSGRGSTILTGGRLGDLAAPQVQAKSLLGG